MNLSSSEVPSRSRSFITRWLSARMQECVHCSDCQTKVVPFTSHCPKCGQANPAKVSVSAVYLVLAFALLILVLSLLAVAI
jgi:uncharacterized OB-fold protein